MDQTLSMSVISLLLNPNSATMPGVANRKL